LSGEGRKGPIGPEKDIGVPWGHHVIYRGAVRRRAHRVAGALAVAVLAGCGNGADHVPEAREAMRSVVAALPVPGRLAPPSGDAVFVAPVGLPRPAGERMVTATVGGIERRWIVVVPPSTTDDVRLPMLIVLHGVGSHGAAMRTLGFDRLASSAGMIVAYPDAAGPSWNDGRPGMEPLVANPADDVAFLRELVRRSVIDHGVDPDRVAVTGYSNGALMAARAACDMADQLAAVVLVAGAGPRDVAQRCRPSRPVPLMMVFGTADAVVPYDGGQVAPFGGRARGAVAPVREVLDVWRSTNGCSSSIQHEHTGAPRPVQRHEGVGCRAEVVHYRVQGGGHEWVSTPGFDTTAEAWRFVQAQLQADDAPAR
jgi:polyhydroxybutyrate depolymerase